LPSMLHPPPPHTHTYHCTVNKRLDEWVHEDNIDPDRLQLPRKESKIGALTKQSRQPSPVEVSTPTSIEPRKLGALVGRKRKHDSVEVGQCRVRTVS
jgi:hypothetical protein